MDIITANSNPRVKRLVKLNKDAAFRKEENVFVVEGIRMFRELPMENVCEIYMSESAYDKYMSECECSDNNKYNPDCVYSDNQYNDLRLFGTPTDEIRRKITLLSDSVFKTVSQTKSPQGILAIVKRFDYKLDEILETANKKQENRLYLILESIQDPGNLGTIVRTAEATGVTCIIIGGETCDIYNPKVIRSTMGAIFRVPFVNSTNLIKTVDILKSNNVTVYGAHLCGNNLYSEKFNGNTAFLIGNEGNGLSEEISSKADKLIKIPMNGRVESLNAAVSTSILCYEVYRQNYFSRQN